MKYRVSKESVLNALLEKGQSSKRYRLGETWELNYPEIIEAIDAMPVDAIPSEIVIHCKDCKYWDTDGYDEDDPYTYGYCHAIKHGVYTPNWEISIRRKYKGDFYCADAEPIEEDEEEDEQ